MASRALVVNAGEIFAAGHVLHRAGHYSRPDFSLSLPQSDLSRLNLIQRPTSLDTPSAASFA
jgi:hypothetical protein